MPDFERLTRKIAVDLAQNEYRRAIIAAEHRGEDRARMQVAIAAAITAAPARHPRNQSDAADSPSPSPTPDEGKAKAAQSDIETAAIELIDELSQPGSPHPVEFWQPDARRAFASLRHAINANND